MAERGFNPGTAASISIVLRVPIGLHNWSDAARFKSAKKRVLMSPYSVINKAIVR